MNQNAADVETLKNKIEDLRKKSEADRQIVRDFISCVSHELRTPVAVLRGSLEALCDGVIYEPEKVSEYHRQMLSESIYLQRLVNDLLEFSRLQNDDFEIVTEPVNVYDVIDDVCRSLKKIAADKKINLLYEKNGQDIFVNADYMRIRQMFIVVIDNAIKFTDPGGSAEIKSGIFNGTPMIIVSDNGCGIEESELSSIFLKFHRTVSEKNRSGSGLGLAIAEKIAKRHNIDINVRSKVGYGTQFCFIFNKTIDKSELCDIID